MFLALFSGGFPGGFPLHLVLKGALQESKTPKEAWPQLGLYGLGLDGLMMVYTLVIMHGICWLMASQVYGFWVGSVLRRERRWWHC